MKKPQQYNNIDEQVVRLKIQKKKKMKEKQRKREKRDVIIASILSVIIIFMMVGLSLHERITYLALAHENKQIQEQIDDTKSRNDYYLNEYESIAVSDEIRDYAINVLGMIPINPDAVVYVKGR